MTHTSKSLEDTKNIAEDFLATLAEIKSEATIVALHGDLGSGKTTFTQSVARILGVTETVTSPTFVIEKIYKLNDSTKTSQTPSNSFSHLIHIDAYRLEGGRELMNLGWKEISGNPHNLIFIEWPEKVEDILPKNMKHLYFKFIDETTREIVFE